VSLDAKDLFELLPAVHRIRDAGLARDLGLERGPLEELVEVLAEQIAVAAEGLDQLHDDLFIETCADWVVPYIGDLIGYQGLHSVAARVASPRAEVAHTIALRRRKGTALVLEQLARDVTGWDARAVEYFQRLATTQYMNHPRPHSLQSPDLRRGEALEWIGSAFESASRTVDVRHIESGRGRHNIPNVGLHLWRIRAYPHRTAPAFRAGPRRYRASPLNHDVPLYNAPLAEDDISHLAEPDNVPWPLSRRRLAAHLDRHYGGSGGGTLAGRMPALVLSVNGSAIERNRILVCDLSDEGPGWVHTPPPDGQYAIDPVLGRVALPGDAPDPADVRLTWHEGFSADLGGGEYERGDSLPAPADGTAPLRVPDDHPTIAAALAALGGSGIVEITDNGRYSETLAIAVAADGAIEIRAANRRRPVVDLGGLSITGGGDAACTLNGLLLTGAGLEVPDDGSNALARLNLLHCTLVPGIALGTDGSPLQPLAPSLRLALAGLETRIERSIVGSIRSHDRASVAASDSLIDATAPDRVAFAAADGAAPGAGLTLEACTVIGKLHAAEMHVSNSILLAALAAGDSWSAAVRAARRQVGCVRFSWLPFDAIAPRRHRCQPDSAEAAQRVAPHFSSLRYGTPAYGQLTTTTPTAILHGASDESEMGVFHHLYGAQRETNLRIRLAEYLRVGLHAGVFYES
jgi:hypothetical protein